MQLNSYWTLDRRQFPLFPFPFWLARQSPLSQPGCGVRFLHLAFNSSSTIFNKSKFHSYFCLLVCNSSEMLDQFTFGCGRNKYGCYTATLRRPGFILLLFLSSPSSFSSPPWSIQRNLSTFILSSHLVINS